MTKMPIEDMTFEDFDRLLGQLENLAVHIRAHRGRAVVGARDAELIQEAVRVLRELAPPKLSTIRDVVERVPANLVQDETVVKPLDWCWHATGCEQTVNRRTMYEEVDCHTGLAEFVATRRSIHNIKSGHGPFAPES